MNITFVDLIKNQFCANWEDARTLRCSDHRRNSVHTSLGHVYDYLKNANIDTKITDEGKRNLCIIFEMFARWTEILQLENILPTYKELTKTLEHILSEWVGEESKDFIVSITEGEYSTINPFYDLTTLNDITDVGWHAHFDYIILEIRAPRYFFEDMFSNSVLFHELGHFIDFKQHFSDTVFSDIKDILEDPALNSTLISQSFPYLAATGYKPSRDEKKVRSHIQEYFADIFGTQYVGEHILNHVLRRADNLLDAEDSEHPCANSRLAMVTEFLKYCSIGTTTNILLNGILNVAHNANGDKLKCHYGNVNSSQLIRGHKISITNDTQLYGVYKTIWNLYDKGLKIFTPINPKPAWSKSTFEWYKLLNFLAKDSINTYL